MFTDRDGTTEELYAASEEARQAIDGAITLSKRSLTELEARRAAYGQLLDSQQEAFDNLRSQLNSTPKLSRHALRIGTLDAPAVAMTEHEELAEGLAELARGTDIRRREAINDFFKKRPVREAVALVEEGRARIRNAREVGFEPFDETERRIEAQLRQELANAQPHLDAWADRCEQLSPEWESEAWGRWQPSEEIPFAVGLGEGMMRTTPFDPAETASGWCLNGGQSLLLWDNGAPVIAQVQALILRILAQFPPGMARFVFVDPLGAGKSVAPFLHLSDYDEALVGGKVWSESTHIEQRLGELQAHIEMVVQKYLRGQFKSIEAHNAAAGEIAEAYRFLVVFDFPAGFTESAARRLVSIARNGPACGVYAIVVASPGREIPHGFDIGELTAATQLFEVEGSKMRLAVRGNEPHPWRIDLEQPPPLELTDPGVEKNVFTRVLSEVGAKSSQAANVEVSQERLLQLLESTLASGLSDGLPKVEQTPRLDQPETWWSGDASDGISAPIGRLGARAVQTLSLVGTDTSVHALVAGKTGSGKSTLLHATILNLCLLYSPAELELYLVDFKQGVEFKPYALAGLPHARIVAIESEREFGLSVLRGLEAEMIERGARFRGAEVDDLADFRRSTGEEMARILLVADEFHVLFADDDAVANEAARILDSLVRQGRSFGIHTILASQTISGVHQVGRGTMNQIAVRIALQCSESDSQVIFGEDNADARMLSRPGEAIYNAKNGMAEGNRRFQVVMLHDDERERLLSELRLLADRRGRARRPVVFEGNSEADLERNEELAELLAEASLEGPPRAWVGEPISLEGPVAVEFDRRAGQNLMVVGSEASVTTGVLSSALLALAPQVGAAAGRIDVIDFGGMDEPFAATCELIAAANEGVVELGRRRQLAAVLAQIAAELGRRIEAPSLPAPPRFLVLHRLQAARELDAEGSSFDEAAASVGERLGAILRDGPEFGIHTLLCCDSLKNLERRLDHAAQREFGLRLVSRMSEADSLQLIDGPAAAGLVGAQAILLDEDRSRQVKLRAYGGPSADWLAGAFGAAAGTAPIPATPPSVQ